VERTLAEGREGVFNILHSYCYFRCMNLIIVWGALILLLESPTNCMGMRDSCTVHVVHDSKLDFWDYIGSLLL